MSEQTDFQEAVAHVSSLTPRERAALRSRQRRRQIRLTRQAKRERAAELEARRKARRDDFLKKFQPQPVASFLFSPSIRNDCDGVTR
jgi:hypothetical protein